MNPAQATRLAKERHPERYCRYPRCLWRVKHSNAVWPYLDDTPCPKHMAKEIDLMEALKKSLKAEAATPIVRGSKVRRIDEPYVVLHVREVDVEGRTDGGAKVLCFNDRGHGKWMRIDELEVLPS